VAVLETCPCVMQEVDVALLKEILEDLAKLAIDEVLELPEENGGMPSNERDYSGRPEDFPMPVQFLATLLTDDCAAAVRMRKLLAKACGDGLLPSECVGEISADFGETMKMMNTTWRPMARSPLCKCWTGSTTSGVRIQITHSWAGLEGARSASVAGRATAGSWERRRS
jgi:hypothetical protein